MIEGFVLKVPWYCLGIYKRSGVVKTISPFFLAIFGQICMAIFAQSSKMQIRIQSIDRL
jgi:hypothetical protein